MQKMNVAEHPPTLGAWHFTTKRWNYSTCPNTRCFRAPQACSAFSSCRKNPLELATLSFIFFFHLPSLPYKKLITFFPPLATFLPFSFGSHDENPQCSNWCPSLFPTYFQLLLPRVSQFSTSTFWFSCQLSKLDFPYPLCHRVGFSFLHPLWHLFLPLIACFSTSTQQVLCQLSKLTSPYPMCHLANFSFLCLQSHVPILSPIYPTLPIATQLVVLIIKIYINSNINNIVIVIVIVIVVDDDDDY